MVVHLPVEEMARVRFSLVALLNLYNCIKLISVPSYQPVQYPDYGEENDYPNIQEMFENYIHNNYRRRKPVTMGIICDEHLPDENSQPMRLVIELLNISMPEIIVHNGDMVDLSAESRYPSSNADKVIETLGIAFKRYDNYWS